jgi:hypothetical protein
MTTQTLYPVANSVSPTQVRETDDAYIIEDVPFIRPMRLAGGYVPERSVRETSAQWDGVPATLNHPRDDDGRPVAANEQPETHIGTTEDPYYDGEHVRGNIRLEKSELQDSGEASDIEAALESGEPIDVSSQYASVDLPPGEYDGAHRQNAERIVRPDSVAILPNRSGVCSIEDGCGINPELAANAAVSVPMTANRTHSDKDMTSSAEAEFESGDLVRWSTSASPGTGRVADVVTEPGESVSAEGADVTREATEDEAAYKLDNWLGPEAGYDEGVVVKSASEIIGSWDDAPDAAMSANVDVPDKYRLDNPGEAVEMAQEMGFGEDSDLAGDDLIHTHGEGSDTDFMPGPSHQDLVEKLREMGELEMDAAGSSRGAMSENAIASALGTLRQALLGGGTQADDGEIPEDLDAETAAAGDVDRDQLVEDVVANSPLTTAALEARCDDGLQAIHSDVMANIEGGTGEGEGTDTEPTDSETTMSNDNDDDTIGLDDLSDEAADELVSRAEKRIQANREDEQKEELATEIIANSANYDSDDREALLETPLEVLRDLKANATTGTSGIPGGGLSGNASVADGAESTDTEDYPDGVLN